MQQIFGLHVESRRLLREYWLRSKLRLGIWAVDFQRYVERGMRLGAHYIDLRFESFSLELVGAEDGKPKETGYSFEQGVGVRALAGGAWGFSASRVEQENRSETIVRVVWEAVKLALTLRDSQPVRLAPAKVARDTVVCPQKIDPSNISLAEKMKLR